MSDIVKRVVNGFQLSDGSVATLIDDSSVNRNNTWSSEEIMEKIFPNISKQGNPIYATDFVSFFPVQIQNKDNEIPITITQVGKNLFGHKENQNITSSNRSCNILYNNDNGEYTFEFNNSSSSFAPYILMARTNSNKEADPGISSSPGALDIAVARLIPSGNYTFSLSVKSAQVRNDSGEWIEDNELKQNAQNLLQLKIGRRKTAGLNGISTDINHDNAGTIDVYLANAADESNGIVNSFNLEEGYWAYLSTFGFNLKNGEGYKNFPNNAKIVCSIQLERTVDNQATPFEKCEYKIHQLEAEELITTDLISEQDTFLSLDNVQFTLSGKSDLLKALERLEQAIISLGAI